MTLHTPTCTAAVYTCDRCSFRAVLTTRGVFVLDSGDGKQAHLEAITLDRAQRREWVYTVVTRLRGMRDTSMPLTPRQRERLVRCLMMEYGNG